MLARSRFTSALFPEVQTSRRLIVKVQSAGVAPPFEKAARVAIAGRGDITLLGDRMSDQEIERLIAESSVFLSPHKSEGFGLAIAEALMADVPALATGWSGNLDFMRGVPELCIPYHLASVRDAGGVYRFSDTVWAEPHVAGAAQKLRALAASAELRQSLAARAKASIVGQLGAWSNKSLAQTPFGRFADAR